MEQPNQPKKKQIPEAQQKTKDDSSSLDESMNKYDSDEESNKNQELDDDKDSIDDNEINKSEQSDEDSEEFPDLNIGSVISKIKDFDDYVFKYEHLPYKDQITIDAIKELNNNREGNNILRLHTTFVKLMQNFSSDDVDQCFFFSEVFLFLLKKTFFNLKNQGVTQELVNIFDITQRFAAELLSKNLNFINNTKTQNKKNIVKNSNLCNNSLQVIDYVIELYYIFITIKYLSLPEDFINSSLTFLVNLFINKNVVLNDNVIYIKKYIETIRQIIINRKKLQVNFTLEQYKDIYSLGFILMKDKLFINIFYYIIEMLCDIIEIVDDSNYIDKFITEFLLCFNSFLEFFGLNKEEFKMTGRKCDLYSKYLNYFGEYKLTNSEHISLFTYFFIKVCSFLYIKNNINYLKFLDEFLHKIITHNNSSFLLFLLFLFKDFVKMKYDIELSISINIITNIYLCITSLLEQSDTNLIKKKFLTGIVNFFLENLLKDLLNIRNSYLCFGKQNDELKQKLKHKSQENDEKNQKSEILQKKNKKNKKSAKKSIDKNERSQISEKECNCFSCLFSLANKNNKNDYFKCGKCDIKTNLRLQLIDPNKDDDLNTCGFCNITDYFESFANIFENEKKLELCKSNDISFSQYNQSKEKLNNDSQSKIMKKIQEDEAKNPENLLFNKCIFYQEMMYKKVFLFLKINLLNFIYTSNQTQNQEKIKNLNRSFKIFLCSLIQEEKLKDKNYITFIDNLEQFFNVQRERVFSLHQDINIDEKTIHYFYFFHFYINFLFSGHWKIVEILISDKSQNWQIKYLCMKILEKFINIDKEANIFQNFAVKIIGPLLCDCSLNIREYSFELLFKLYQKKKIARADLIYILYNNINESSFLIRKRTIKALSNLVFFEKERESLKSIILIFLNKIYDNSESEKIKELIYEFFIQIFKNDRTNNNELIYYTLNVIIQLFTGCEESTGNFNNFLTEQLTLLFEKINDKVETYALMIDHLMKNFILVNDEIEIEEDYSLNQRLLFIYSLNLIQILSKYHKKSISIYIEYFNDFLNFQKFTQVQNNKVVLIVCNIINNYFFSQKEENPEIKDETASIKNIILSNIENTLINIIMNKASILTLPALKAYFSMIHDGIIDINKIEKFALMNFTFLVKLKEDQEKIKTIPVDIISKSLIIFSYIIYSLDDESIIDMFKENENNYNNLDTIKELIFSLLSSFYFVKTEDNNNDNYDKNEDDNIHSLISKSFESFSYFFVRFPEFLMKSEEIIQKTFDNLNNSQEKLRILRTFIRLFKDISNKCEDARKKGNNSFDFGVVHLFFDNFLDKISIYLIEENYEIIRLETIKLIKLIIDLGDLNVHKIIPYAFASLFDYVKEIRCIAVDIIQKGFTLSKDKTYNGFIEGLKQAYLLQKNIFGSTKLINSFVKIIDVDTKEFKISNENVFELLFYKICKKNIKVHKKIIEKFVIALRDISSIEKLFNNSNNSNNYLSKCLNSFEYFEFITKLIGDFKFVSPDEVFLVFDKIFADYENHLCIFKSKFKKYKEEEVKKMDLNLIYLFLTGGMYLFLIRYLLIKYQICTDNQLSDIAIKGWKNFYESNLDVDAKNMKLPKKIEMKNIKFKFIEFYSNFEILYIQLFDNQTKPNKNFTEENKTKICDYLSKLKNFANIPINEFIKLYNNRRRTYSDLTFKLLFCNKSKKISLNTDIKQKNRFSLQDKKYYARDEIDEDEKDENVKNAKRNVKKEIKFNKTDVKGKKRNGKYRKTLTVMENEVLDEEE